MKIQKDIFINRRQILSRKIKDNSCVIIGTNPLQARSKDTNYSYRPDSDFYYLTGFSEPHALLVMIKSSGVLTSILFCEERDSFKEMWEGEIIGTKRAKSLYGLCDAVAIDIVDTQMPKILAGLDRVYFSMSSLSKLLPKINYWNEGVSKTRYQSSAPREFIDIDFLIHEMRIIKDKYEIDLMQKSADIAATAHIIAMKKCKPGMYEYQLEAEFIYEFRKHGSPTSYDSIVGGGNNACVLHYRENNCKLKSGELVLIDAGCEYQMYASDITRTFPVSGIFSDPQRQIYELVYEANRAAIKKVTVGNLWSDPHDEAARVITKGLIEIGLLKGSFIQLLKKEAYKEFFMHKTGHWLGIDVHDVGAYLEKGNWRSFKSGMVTTIEPGIYINKTSSAPIEFKGIGIRLEDDILVTAKVPRVLSSLVPIKLSEVESLIGTH
jgi:Xaa-Pro aminopeptidase